MFFIEQRLLHNMDTVIPNSFFEIIMPILAPEPYAISVYLYGYYLSLNAENISSEVDTSQALADKLGISIDEVYNAWKLCEEIGIIKKHIIDEEVAGSYSIEFRDLRTVVGKTAKKPATTDELIIAYQNEEYKKMYDKIEQATKYPLIPSDIRKIHQTIAEFNVSKDLVVEAVLYTIYKKNKRSIAVAMGVLRNWYIDGIRTVEDLEKMMQGKEKRYLEYKKILSALGEYRTATQPEKEMMDMWLDEFRFDLETILDSVGKTISIKSPNLKYVDGVLKNRLKAVNKLQTETGMADIIEMKADENDESVFEIRNKILELIKFTRKSLRKDEKDDLDELAKDFGFSDIEIAYRYLLKNGKSATINDILKLLKGGESADKKKKITLKDVLTAEQQTGTYQNFEQSRKKTKNLISENHQKPMGPVAKKMLERRLLVEKEQATKSNDLKRLSDIEEQLATLNKNSR